MALRIHFYYLHICETFKVNQSRESRYVGVNKMQPFQQGW